MNSAHMTKAKLPHRLKIVTVDDSPIITQRLRSILADMDNVEFLGTANNASTALGLIHKLRPNVVILDIHLDDNILQFNGIDLLIALRKRYPDMKIIMLTNLTEDQYRTRCIGFGANYFFDKSNEFYRIPDALQEIALAGK
jgi:DNA-binding NarL/FixJ family response regulator